MAVLSADDVYLLNTLSYLKINDYPPNTDVQDIAQSIINEIEAGSTRYVDGDFQNNAEILHACEQIVKGEAFDGMTLVASNTETDGGACFVVTTAKGSSPREAIVVFQGTVGEREWKDDFVGGGPTDQPDGVSTECQIEALDWYQSPEVQSALEGCDYVTTTGHSKGGNKAKYIAVLDGSPDRCISFDGQGFSDEFYETYSNEIAAQQHKVTNYNASRDYVNLLLNDIGERIYIQGTDESNFAAYHSLFNMVYSHPLSDHQTKQDPGLAAMDNLLNSYLRSLSAADRVDKLEVIGTIFSKVLTENFTETDLEVLISDPQTAQHLGDLLAYIVAYARDNPNQTNDILGTVSKLIPGSDKYIGFVNDFLDFIREHPFLTELLATGGKGLVALLNLDFVRELAAKNGISPEMLDFILDVASRVLNDYDNAAFDDGDDLQLTSTYAGANKIHVEDDLLLDMAARLETISNSLSLCVRQIRDCAEDCARQDFKLTLNLSLRMNFLAMASRMLAGIPSVVLTALSVNTSSLSDEAKRLAGKLRRVVAMFDDAESTIANRVR